jgi:hypothetical protein
MRLLAQSAAGQQFQNLMAGSEAGQVEYHEIEMVLVVHILFASLLGGGSH